MNASTAATAPSVAVADVRQRGEGGRGNRERPKRQGSGEGEGQWRMEERAWERVGCSTTKRSQTRGSGVLIGPRAHPPSPLVLRGSLPNLGGAMGNGTGATVRDSSNFLRFLATRLGVWWWCWRWRWLPRRRRDPLEDTSRALTDSFSPPFSLSLFFSSGMRRLEPPCRAAGALPAPNQAPVARRS